MTNNTYKKAQQHMKKYPILFDRINGFYKKTRLHLKNKLSSSNCSKILTNLKKYTVFYSRSMYTAQNHHIQELAKGRETRYQMLIQHSSLLLHSILHLDYTIQAAFWIFWNFYELPVSSLSPSDILRFCQSTQEFKPPSWDVL